MAQQKTSLLRTHTSLFLDKPPSAEAMSACPNGPWLHNVTRAEAEGLIYYIKEPSALLSPEPPVPDASENLDPKLLYWTRFTILVRPPFATLSNTPGNVRVPFPEDVIHANHRRWLDLVARLYLLHPAIIKSERPLRRGERHLA